GASAHTYTLSLHDALPIYERCDGTRIARGERCVGSRIAIEHDLRTLQVACQLSPHHVVPELKLRRVRDIVVRAALDELSQARQRSEEHTSELQSRENLVCR